MGSSGGNKKSSKRDQPKRKRYVADGRRDKNAVKKLLKHIRKYAKDEQDDSANKALIKRRGY